jgi:D-alanyl-D-alanine carboxypeptidase/D-alanyl-D-alanine-endopeptidase (penicillin-binding protein 4)
MASSRRWTPSSRTAAAAVVLAIAAAPGPTKAERRLAADLDRIFDAPIMEQGLWGVEVKSLDSGRVLYARNRRTLMMPASNMKILTLAAAAEALGWDYRFTTTLDTPGTIEDGALKGDLYVRGTGDPTINTRDRRADAIFDEWAAALKTAGITRIDGNIIGDASAFDDATLGHGWSWDDLQYGYSAPVTALQLDENVAALTIRPGAKPGDPAELQLPPDTGLAILHHVDTGPSGSATPIALERRPGTHALDVRGSIAVDAAPVTRDVAIADPELYFAHTLLLALDARGIHVRGLPRARARPEFQLPPPEHHVIVESPSPPLRDIATTMMKVSQNLYAETLLKAVGAARGGGTGSAEAGIEAARAIFAAWQIPPSTYVQVDGSGLSRYDYVTADMIVTVLDHLYRDPKHRDAFIHTLPIAGTDGTIASRLKHTRAEANATAKTGSISNVRSLSGYVRTRDGETLAFSILANAFAIPAATVNYIADVAVETLANYSAR